MMEVYASSRQRPGLHQTSTACKTPLGCKWTLQNCNKRLLDNVALQSSCLQAAVLVGAGLHTGRLHHFAQVNICSIVYWMSRSRLVQVHCYCWSVTLTLFRWHACSYAWIFQGFR